MRMRALAGASAAGMAIHLGGLALNLLAAVLLARWLGPAGFGAYAVFLTLAMLLSTLCGLGMPNMILREAAILSGRRGGGRGEAAGGTEIDARRLRGLLTASRAALLAAAAAFCALAWLALAEGPLAGLAPAAPGEGGREAALAAALVLASLVAAAEIEAAILQGLGRTVLGRLVHVLRPALLCAALGAAWAAGARPDPAGALWLHAGAGLAAAVAMAALARRAARRVLAETAPARAWRVGRWAGSCPPLLLARFGQSLARELPVLLLGALAPIEAAGFYRIASRAAALVPVGLMAVAATLRPTLARSFAAGETAALQAALTRGARLILAISAPAALALLVAGPWAVTLAFGADYAAAAPALLVLVAAQFLNAMTGMTASVLNMARREWTVVAARAASLLCLLGVGLALAPWLGAAGGAAAAAAEIVVFNLLLAGHIRRRLGLSVIALAPAPTVAPPATGATGAAR